MFLRDFGSGPTILFLHGTPSPADDWLPIAAQLASRYRVLVPDLPGYGHSPPPADASYAITNQQIADAVPASLHAIVGFSTGAYRALEMTLRGRVQTTHVVSIGGMATFDDANRDMRRQFASLIEADPGFLASLDCREAMRDLMLSPAWLAAHPDDLERVCQWLHITPPRALAAELRALAEIPDLRPELPRLRAQLYLRVGALDAGALPAWSEEMHHLVPGSTLDVVPRLRSHALDRGHRGHDAGATARARALARASRNAHATRFARRDPDAGDRTLGSSPIPRRRRSR